MVNKRTILLSLQAPEDVSGLFDRGSGGPRTKPKSHQNRNKKRSKPNIETNDGAPDDTLLGNSIRRKEFEKKTKMEKKKKKAGGGGKEPTNAVKPPPEGVAAAVGNASTVSSTEKKSVVSGETQNSTEASNAASTSNFTLPKESQDEKMAIE